MGSPKFKPEMWEKFLNAKPKIANVPVAKSKISPQTPLERNEVSRATWEKFINVKPQVKLQKISDTKKPSRKINTDDPLQDKAEIARLQDLISKKLITKDGAKKAALIISEMLNKDSKK